jgi:hypothetical protein
LTPDRDSSATKTPEGTVASAAPVPVSDPRDPRSTTSAALDSEGRLAVSEAVEAGDLLALDPTRPGHLRRAATLADPGVIGVASGPSSEGGPSGTLDAPVVASGIVWVRADAGYGAIRSGDLLVSSPTPGHAMLAIEFVPGTVVGKAIDPLETGTGRIRMLVLAR